MNIEYKQYYIDKDKFFEDYFDAKKHSFDTISKNVQAVLHSEVLNTKDSRWEFVNSLLSFAARYNNIELTQYLFDSPDILIVPNLQYNKQEALYLSIVYNNEEIGKRLVKEFYKNFKNAKGKEEKAKNRISDECFNQACFGNCEGIVEEILNCSKNFYIGNIKEAFIKSCLGLNFELSEKIFNASIIKKGENLFSEILDQYPHDTNLYNIIAFADHLVSKDEKIKALSYILENPLLNPDNHPNYVRKVTYATNFEHVIGLCYKHNNTEILDFLLEHEKTKEKMKQFVDLYLIKALVKDPPFAEYDIKVMINYCAIDLSIPRTPELYDFLKEKCNEENNTRQKDTAQKLMDLYDVLDFNRRLEDKIEKKNSFKKKKV